ncbi:CdaR family transcriptional regulator [Oceanobacillus sp. J11TS1]|uniref:PucR family transcriptional regulator n=1 Tax=Oceanobacillus sp. J11TS1 TaxID=2807191 RepID=UPI001B081562|nr:helix-turn-helix domain-containing protein [Oceanobacillus sp. J11TS1]GIO23272.1 transcriptional activator AdeR [Oceanobacillus sp. J11TS1]
MDSSKTIENKILSLQQSFSTLDDLADMISEVLTCPITIEDANHYVLAYSKHTENIDEARIGTIMNRKVPDKVINGLWKKGIMPKLIDSNQPIIIPEIKEIGLGNRIAISIWKKNEILGFIWAHTGEKEYTADDLEILKEATRQVKKFILNKLPGRKNTEKAYRDFFWQLLTSESVSTDVIHAYEKQFNIKLQDGLAIVVFRFQDAVIPQIEKHAYYLSETIMQVNTIFRLFDDHDFILLVRLWKSEDAAGKIYEFIKQFKEKISTQLHLTSMHGAASQIYNSAKDMKHAYEEALQTISLQEQFPDELSSCFLYEDLGVFQWIDILKDRQQKCRHPNKYIYKLQQYDKSQQSNLLYTLEKFLEHDSNVHRAAKALFIHPNTMNYRLKRIHEISHLDLKNPHQKVAVYLELLANKLETD